MKLTHLDKRGKAKMVDVSEKEINLRTSSASAEVILSKEAFLAVKNNTVVKGDVLSVARIAGIQAAKKTSELIPLCHNIFISSVNIDFKLSEETDSILITSDTKTNSVTGIEMEALTAVSIAALTIYDMCKAIDKGIRIKNIHLLSKTGGKSGGYFAK
ncbi:MAG: cyclic pyranopterin monophosphate synthase MoaC [Ignavibacteriaceae bacterium]|nr:cyclic pyranopterin monophosphate synthase MoaC [Ignavibacteriaceae bacterium]